MNEIMNKVISNPINLKVLNFLEVDLKEISYFISRSQLKEYTHETLENFLALNIPEDCKYILDGNGIIINHYSGEIVAFQTGLNIIAFKTTKNNGYNQIISDLRMNFLRTLRFKNFFKLGLNYFSNIEGDDIIDIRSLGRYWVLEIYFDDYEEKIIEYLNSNK